mgnify:CR=1 FL=1
MNSQLNNIILTPAKPVEETFFSNLSLNTSQLIFFILLAVLIFGFFLLPPKYRRPKYLLRHLRILVLVLSIPFTIAFIGHQTGITTRAQKDLTPRNIQTSQVLTNQFTLSWRTSSPTIGTIRVSKSPTMDPVLINKSEPTNEPLRAHQITITNLESSTTYFLEILSENTWYNNDGLPIAITTLP